MVISILHDWLVEVVPNRLLLLVNNHICLLMIFAHRLVGSLARLSLLRDKAPMEPVGMVGSIIALNHRFISDRTLLLHLLRHCYTRRLLQNFEPLHRCNR